MFRLFIVVLFASLGLYACKETPQPPPSSSSALEALKLKENIPFRKDGELTFIRSNGTPIVTIGIEIAATDSARQRGLMQRKSLPPRSGMLFIFERAQPQSFWMANTPLALDIIFVGPDSQIVYIAKYAKPFSTEPITSPYPAQFVVEVPAGFVDEYGIVEGDRIRWKYLSPTN